MDVFDWACKKLEEASLKRVHWLLLDEIGPLELKGKGLATALIQILNNPAQANNLVLVIREKMLKQVDNHFELNRFEVEKFEFPE